LPAPSQSIARNFVVWKKDYLGKIVPLNNINKFDLPVSQVLDGAKYKLQDVVLLGYCKGGQEEYFATSMSDAKDLLWLLERCKKTLLNVLDEE